jgi:hypothetical protein
MHNLFSGRSVPAALRDTAALVEELLIDKNKVLSVSADRWGDASILAEPGEFVRVFNIAKAMQPDIALVWHPVANSLNASFGFRLTRFAALVDPNSPEHVALMADEVQCACAT